MKRTLTFLLPMLALCACSNTPNVRVYLASQDAPFSENCRTITLDTPSGQYTLDEKHPEILSGGTAYTYTITARCLSKSGQVSGQTTRTIKYHSVVLASSENHPALAAEYARHSPATGIFPVIREIDQIPQRGPSPK